MKKRIRKFIVFAIAFCLLISESIYLNSANVDAKRITLEPEELEAGLLGDLLEQFISEYKRGF